MAKRHRSDTPCVVRLGGTSGPVLRAPLRYSAGDPAKMPEKMAKSQEPECFATHATQPAPLTPNPVNNVRPDTCIQSTGRIATMDYDARRWTLQAPAR